MLGGSSARTSSSCTSRRAGPLARAGRSRPDRAGDHEPRGQRPRRHARRRQTLDRDAQRGSWTRHERLGARLSGRARRYVLLAVSDTGVGHGRGDAAPASSSRSSRPRSEGKGTGLACRRSTGSSSRAAARLGLQRAGQRKRLQGLPAPGRRAPFGQRARPGHGFHQRIGDDSLRRGRAGGAGSRSEALETPGLRGAPRATRRRPSARRERTKARSTSW